MTRRRAALQLLSCCRVVGEGNTLQLRWRMHHSRALAALLLVVLVSPFRSANALPGCDAWLQNEVPIGPGKFLVPTPGRLVTVDMNQVTAAGRNARCRT